MSPASDAAELTAVLTLLALPGLPQTAVARLIQQYGNARNALHAWNTSGARDGGMAGGREADAAGESAAGGSRGTVLTPNRGRNESVSAADVSGRVERALAVLERDRVQVLALTDPRYPEIMRQRLGAHAPPVLFARGDLSLLELPQIAVVGCRAASGYGLDVASEIGGGVARAGGCVVSGMARGIDAAAHAAALDAGGATIGVLGCGIDIVYPREHRRLQARVAEAGLLITEQLPGEPPRQHNFPHRNRIISALARAVVVVEAAERSGAVATANHAASQGVPVFGVPNLLHQPTAQGVLALFRDGAGVYTGLRDLLESAGLIGIGEQMSMEAGAVAQPPVAGVHALVWDALADGPIGPDTIARTAGVEPSAALVALLELELDGRVRSLPGQRFQRALTPARR